MRPADDPDFQRAGLGCLAVVTGLLCLFLLVRLGAHVATGKVAFLSPGQVRMELGPKSRANLWTDTFYRPRHSSIPDGACVIAAPAWHALGLPVSMLLVSALCAFGSNAYRRGEDYGGLVLGVGGALLIAYFLLSFTTTRAIRVERGGHHYSGEARGRPPAAPAYRR